MADTPKYKVFSFFSGAGFLDLGFEKSGYNIVFTNEISKDFNYAYRYSRERMKLPLPKYGVHEEDVGAFLNDNQHLQQLESWMQYEKKTGGLVGFIGGPPCPDFSVAGKNKGAEGKNGILSQVYMDLICKLKPDFFLFENVKGLWRTAKHRTFFDSLVRQAKESGYSVTYRLVNALEYGVPQDRDRILMIGIRNSLNPKADTDGHIKEFPWTTGKWMSLDTIKAMPFPSKTTYTEKKLPPPSNIPLNLTVEYWFKENDVTNHPNAQDHFKPKAALNKMVAIDEGDDSKKSYKRLHRWRYSPTVAYGNNEVHWHPYKHRRLSVSEALALQSLPKEYELPADMTLTAKFKTIGNGVPYLLSKSIAERLKIFLEGLPYNHGKDGDNE